MRRLAFYVVVIAATLALLILLWQFRSVVILLILSLVLTAALRPTTVFHQDVPTWSLLPIRRGACARLISNSPQKN